MLNELAARDPKSRRDLAGLRRGEMAKARDILGFEHRWLGYEDSGLPDEGVAVPQGCFADVPTEISAEALVRIVREFKPHVMITYNEQGGYPHPDHVMTHHVTMRAVEAAADPEFGDGEPWLVQKVYYDVAFSHARIEAAHAAILAAGGESPYAEWIARMERREQRPVTARVHAAEAGTSVSNLVANFLRTVAADTNDEFARLVALQRQIQSSVVGFSARDNVSRDEAHDRAPR